MLYLNIIAFLLLLISYLYPATKGFSEKPQNFKVTYLLTTNTFGWLSYIYLFTSVVLEALAMILALLTIAAVPIFVLIIFPILSVVFLTKAYKNKHDLKAVGYLVISHYLIFIWSMGLLATFLNSFYN